MWLKRNGTCSTHQRASSRTNPLRLHQLHVALVVVPSGKSTHIGCSTVRAPWNRAANIPLLPRGRIGTAALRMSLPILLLPGILAHRARICCTVDLLTPAGEPQVGLSLQVLGDEPKDPMWGGTGKHSSRLCRGRQPVPQNGTVVHSCLGTSLT